MRGILVALCCALTVGGVVTPVSAATTHRSGGFHSQQGSAIDWSTHDTAVYVVSTVNLLRTRSGRPIGGLLRHKLAVRHYNVYADATLADLYYIDLVRADATAVGALAYKMGWQKPMSLSPAFDKMGIVHAADSVANGYKSDKKTLIGSFTSTLPQ